MAEYFGQSDESILYNLIEKYGLDYDIEIMKSSWLSWKKRVACFSVLHPDIVYVCGDQPNLRRLIPHIGHELKHREQFYRNRLIYIILAIPFIRRWTIEPEAYAEEDRIRLYMEDR